MEKMTRVETRRREEKGHRGEEMRELEEKIDQK
jgi:hypothetical protein